MNKSIDQLSFNSGCAAQWKKW